MQLRTIRAERTPAYRAAHAALSRALRKLSDRGLVTVHKDWEGPEIDFTPAGLAAALTLVYPTPRARAKAERQIAAREQKRAEAQQAALAELPGLQARITAARRQ